MRIDVFSIFPEMISTWLSFGVVGRALRQGVVEIHAQDLRQGAGDPRRSVDDAPFGGGAGMVLAPGPVFAAVEAATAPRPLFLLGPAGRRFDQAMARELSEMESFSLLCGRYEGVDQRIVDHLVDGVISVGDYVLAGGEVAAMAVVEAAVRLLPGVLGNEASSEEESFSDGMLEYPHYTRPAVFRDWAVPEVLRSGDHGAVRRWRQAESLALTLQLRPDLIEARGGLSEEDERLLRRHGYSFLVEPDTRRRSGDAPPRSSEHEPN